MSHTPGPWTYDDAQEVITDGAGNDIVWGFGDQMEVPANGKLIAAAPAMLQKLKETAACLRAYRAQVERLGCEPWIAVDLDPSIDALIAEAEGES